MIPTDWITLAAAVLAFVTSIITLILTLSSQKKTRYINIVTSSRIQWIGNLRESISELISLLPEDTKKLEKHQSEKQPLLEKLSKCKAKIALYLNPNDDIDKKILSLVNELYLYSRYYHASVDCLVMLDNGSNDYDSAMLDYFLSVLTKESFASIAGKYYDINKIKKLNSSFTPELSGADIHCLVSEISTYLTHIIHPKAINQEVILVIKEKAEELSSNVALYLKDEWQRVKEESKKSFKATSN